MKKNTGKRFLQACVALIVSYLLLNIGSLILCLILGVPLTPSSSDTLFEFAGEYFMFFGGWIAIIGFCLIRKSYRPMLSKLGKGGAGNNLKTALLIGLPCGIGLNLLVALVAILHGDIKLSFATFNPLYILLFIFVIMIQSGAEELAYRFFVYQRVSQLFPKVMILPIILNAALFSITHAGNHDVTLLALVNVVAVGILYSLIIYYFDSFWAVVIAHTSWNFCQNILLGLPNSGNVSCYSIFKLDAATARNSFAYNTGFGIESSLLAFVLIVVACVVIVLVGRKKKAKDAAKASLINKNTEEQFSEPCTAC